MENQLSRANTDIIRLQAEKQQHEKALKMRQACHEIIVFGNESDEPFDVAYSGTNPFSADGGSGCRCIIS